MVRAMVFSPDERLLLSGGEDNTIILWDVDSGEIIHHFDGHGGPVNALAFSPNGRSFISASDDQTARLWDVASGKEVRRYEGHSAQVLSVAMSPDGALAASGSSDRTVRVWRLPVKKQEMRDWSLRTSRDATEEITGTFVGVVDWRVILETQDGSYRAVPGFRFPDKDLDFILAQPPSGRIQSLPPGSQVVDATGTSLCLLDRDKVLVKSSERRLTVVGADQLAVGPASDEPDNNVLAEVNLSGTWQSSGNGSVFEITDDGDSVQVELQSSSTMSRATGVWEKHGSSLTARKWNVVFKSDKRKKTRRLKMTGTIVDANHMRLTAESVRWNAKGKITSRSEQKVEWTRVDQSTEQDKPRNSRSFREATVRILGGRLVAPQSPANSSGEWLDATIAANFVAVFPELNSSEISAITAVIQLDLEDKLIADVAAEYDVTEEVANAIMQKAPELAENKRLMRFLVQCHKIRTQ